MKDADDWDYILNYTDALFYHLSNGIARRTGLSLEDAREEAWVLFEQGCFKLRCGDDDRVRVEPCHSHDDQRAAMEQNKGLADYRRHVIEEAVGRLTRASERLLGISGDRSDCPALKRNLDSNSILTATPYSPTLWAKGPRLI